MDKKDIYEHLAKIYLDASVRDKKNHAVRATFKSPLVISSIVACILAATMFFAVSYQKRARNSELALVIHPDLIKINFNFDPAKKETYTISLNKLDMNRFRAIDFSARREHYNENVSLRVEFTNAFNEKGEVYFQDLGHKWQSYQVDLAEFKTLHDWSSMSSLAFIVEEWNTKEKHGVVYIDNVRFLR